MELTRLGERRPTARLADCIARRGGGAAGALRERQDEELLECTGTRTEEP